MVTLAPDTAVRWVSPAVRNSAVGPPDRSGVTEYQSRQHRGLIGGQYLPGGGGEPVPNRPGGTCRPEGRPKTGRPIAVSTATVRSRRPGRAILARNLAGCPTPRCPKSAAGPKTATAPPLSASPSRVRSARNITRPGPPGGALHGGDGHPHRGAEPVGQRVAVNRIGAQRNRDAEPGTDDRRRHDAGGGGRISERHRRAMIRHEAPIPTLSAANHRPRPQTSPPRSPPRRQRAAGTSRTSSRVAGGSSDPHQGTQLLQAGGADAVHHRVGRRW